MAGEKQVRKTFPKTKSTQLKLFSGIPGKVKGIGRVQKYIIEGNSTFSAQKIKIIFVVPELQDNKLEIKRLLSSEVRTGMCIY